MQSAGVGKHHQKKLLPRSAIELAYKYMSDLHQLKFQQVETELNLGFLARFCEDIRLWSFEPPGYLPTFRWLIFSISAIVTY